MLLLNVAVGSLNVQVPDVVQPLLSVIKTEYVPAMMLLIESVIAPLLQL